jgi:hypothetical protein
MPALDLDIIAAESICSRLSDVKAEENPVSSFEKSGDTVSIVMSSLLIPVPPDIIIAWGLS